MKKKILFLLVLCFAWSTLYTGECMAATGINRDAYQDIFFHTVDEVPSGDPTINASGEYVGDTMQGLVLVYKDVDFGTIAPGTVEIAYALEGYSETKLNICLDGTNDVIATLTTVDTGGWGSYITQQMEVTKKGITGVHDLYFVCVTSPVANLKSFRFDWKYTNITPPALSFKNAWGGAATEIQYARKIEASAKFEQNIGEENPQQAALILTQYDADGRMLECVYDEQTINSNGAASEFYVGDVQKQETAAAAGAFFWLADMTMIAPGAVAPENNPAAPEGSGAGISVVTEDGIVQIYGRGINDERVAVAVVPADYDASAAIWTTAVQMYELKTEGDGFSYQFRMNPDLPSGSYKALVRGEETGLIKEFSYTNPAEIYGILSFISTETDSGAVIEKIQSSADIFGAEAALFKTVSAFDASVIQQGIQNYFAENPLQETNVYKPWLDGLKPVIISQAVLAYCKTGTDAGQAAAYIAQYANYLGIADQADYQKFFNATYQESIAKVIMENIASDAVVSGFSALFEDAVVAGVFNGAQSWGHVDDALTSFGERLGIDTSNYRRLINSAKAELCTNFLGKNFKNNAEISSLFVKLIADYQDEDFYRNNYQRVPSQLGNTIFTLDVMIKPEEETDPSANPGAAFVDLDQAAWAKDQILAMYNAGYVSGKSATEFAPMDSITREEFTALLVRAFGLGQGQADTLGYFDTDQAAWYAPYLASAVQYGIAAGISETEFGVGVLINREQMAAMLQRAVDAVGRNVLPKRQAAAFLDSADIAGYAYDAVIRLAKAEIISGVGGELFAPKKTATRAEAVVMVFRTLENMQ